MNEKEKYSAMLISWYENSFLRDQSQNITKESILDLLEYLSTFIFYIYFNRIHGQTLRISGVTVLGPWDENAAMNGAGFV